MTIYIVKQGDTIEAIANTYGITTQKIIKDNGITNMDNLVIGQSIVIILPNEQVERLGSLSVNGYAYSFINRHVLIKTLPNLTYITLFTYGFTQQGELVPLDDSEIITIARENKVAPMMLISTLTEEGTFNYELSHRIFIDMEVQNRLIENILNNLKTKKYYGLNIDFEFILPEDKVGYVAFIQNITTKLNAQGYEVMVSLAPKTSANQTGLLYEAHDYKEIGEAANAVNLMTYDRGYAFSSHRATAPIDKVREVLDYAVTEIPTEKIYMGVPNYGYDWTLSHIQGESSATSLGNVEAIERAQKFKTVIQYDEVAQAPFYFYYDNTGKQHVVWFEDARSINAKVRLAAEYGIRGISYWSIMKAFPQSWTIVNNLVDVSKRFTPFGS